MRNGIKGSWVKYAIKEYLLSSILLIVIALELLINTLSFGVMSIFAKLFLTIVVNGTVFIAFYKTDEYTYTLNLIKGFVWRSKERC
jgi:hypothetical protein